MSKQNKYMLLLGILFAPQETYALRIGYVSSLRAKCGIAMYMRHHRAALAQRGHTFFSYSTTMPYNRLLQAIDRDNLDILNIQYSPLILPNTTGLLQFMRSVRERRVKVVLTIHEEYPWIVALIAQADQVIYHKHPRYVPLGGKIHRLPMGVPVFSPSGAKAEVRKKYGFAPEHIIIVTVGFMLKWKKQAEMLEALAPYIKAHPRYRVQLLTALNAFSFKEGQEVQQKIREVIHAHNLQDQVVHITTFLPQKELSERLWIADVGYLWSDRNTPSTSASSKEFISARLPLVATVSSHFHDLGAGTLKLPESIGIFARKLVETAGNTLLLARMRNALEMQYQRLCYKNIIERYIEVFKQ